MRPIYLYMSIHLYLTHGLNCPLKKRLFCGIRATSFPVKIDLNFGNRLRLENVKNKKTETVLGCITLIPFRKYLVLSLKPLN